MKWWSKTMLLFPQSYLERCSVLNRTLIKCGKPVAFYSPCFQACFYRLEMLIGSIELFFWLRFESEVFFFIYVVSSLFLSEFSSLNRFIASPVDVVELFCFLIWTPLLFVIERLVKTDFDFTLFHRRNSKFYQKKIKWECKKSFKKVGEWINSWTTPLKLREN